MLLSHVEIKLFNSFYLQPHVQNRFIKSFFHVVHMYQIYIFVSLMVPYRNVTW